MPTIQTLYTGTLTVNTNELSLVTGTSTLGASTIAASGEADIDLSALASGDAVRVRVREKIVAAGSQVVLFDTTYAGPLQEPGLKIPLGLMVNGWDVTVQKVGGTTRSVPYSIRAVA
jgi:2-phosphoglycerate kinase